MLFNDIIAGAVVYILLIKTNNIPKHQPILIPQVIPFKGNIYMNESAYTRPKAVSITVIWVTMSVWHTLRIMRLVKAWSAAWLLCQQTAQQCCDFCIIRLSGTGIFIDVSGILHGMKKVIIF